MEKIDKFFKEKLEAHTTTPPENAWARVESKLSKKNLIDPSDRSKRSDGFSWAWRIAAAILLMGALIGIFIWSKQNPESTNQAVTTSGEKPNENISKVEKPKEVKAPEKNNHVPAVERKQIQPAKDESSRKVKLIETETALAQQCTVKISSENQVEEKEKEKVQATVQPPIASTQRKPIKLEFTLEDVPSEETVATTNGEKSSGIKKVLNMARDMKQGEGLVTNIREKKNELFAHNFITGKLKAQ